MTYKAANFAPPPAKLPKKYEAKETPKMREPVKYERASKKTRS